MSRHPGILGPLILITIGSLLLINTLGYLPLGFWGTLWHLWPVVLILLGIDMIAKHTVSKKVYVFLILLGIVIILGVILMAWTCPIHGGGSHLRRIHLDGICPLFDMGR